MSSEKPIVFFDGYCNLCNGAVQFILQRDHRHIFRYASLQGTTASELIGNSVQNIDTLVLYKNGQTFTRSTAALLIAKELKGLWPLLYGLIIVPRFIRDGIYRYIANHRYRWFGKKETCWRYEESYEDQFLP